MSDDQDKHAGKLMVCLDFRSLSPALRLAVPAETCVPAFIERFNQAMSDWLAANCAVIEHPMDDEPLVAMTYGFQATPIVSNVDQQRGYARQTIERAKADIERAEKRLAELA